MGGKLAHREPVVISSQGPFSTNIGFDGIVNIANRNAEMRRGVCVLEPKNSGKVKNTDI